ncbi:MAG: tyrosine-type recombinase/integrase [Actinomycetota bacterium]|nr:tyrosine-type recombinase/integrase [Actinomycetota bacterium]
MSGPLLLPRWEQLAIGRPVLVATMRRYLSQIACTLRPGSVGGADLALRCFASFLADTEPEIVSVAAVTRRHIEDYKPWLAARPGQKVARLTPNTIAHRLGNLRMFFIRLDEWAWDDAPPRVPIIAGDLPRQDHWLHVPLGKLHDDRYLPLHPHLVELIGDYRERYVHADNPLLLPRENGKPMDRHGVTRYLNRAASAAGIGHVHPHQMRHTLATQAINRGMSLEAIAAMLGHHSMDMTLRYAKIANRTVADEYFAVTDKVEALYGQQQPLPADALGTNMAKLRRDHFRGSTSATAWPEWLQPSSCRNRPTR